MRPMTFRMWARARLTERPGSALAAQQLAVLASTSPTTLVGGIQKQSALFGRLDGIRDLGLELVSVPLLVADRTGRQTSWPDDRHRENRDAAGRNRRSDTVRRSFGTRQKDERSTVVLKVRTQRWMLRSGWRKHLFIATSHITADAANYFGLPPDRTVVMGSRIEI